MSSFGKYRAKLFLLDELNQWIDEGAGWVDVLVDSIIIILDIIPGVAPLRQVTFKILPGYNDYRREGGFINN